MKSSSFHRRWFADMLFVEDGAAEDDESMKEAAMSFPADCCELLQIVKREPSSQIAEGSEQEELNRRRRRLQVASEVERLLLDFVDQLPELIERQSESQPKFFLPIL